MNPVDAYEIIRMTVTTVLSPSPPILVVALVLGLMIAFFQALTQIQEMTLVFVPKILAIFLALAISLPFVFGTLTRLSDRVFDTIVSGGF